MLKWLGRFRIIRYSPLDLRIFLRIILLFTAWKWLSIDYTALSDLLQGPQLQPISPEALAPLLRFLEFIFLGSVRQIHVLQVLAAALLVLTAVRPSRLLLSLGLLPVLLFEWCAMLYRAPNYDIDLGVALLLMAVVLPFSWKGVFIGGDEKITPQATRAGWCFAAYVGGMYLMCGISKLAYDPQWWLHVRLDLLYFVMQVWHGAKFPAWQEPIARQVHEVFWHYPLLWQTAAFATMCCELGWMLSLFSSTARRVIPLMMLASHIMIFLASTILFLGMAVIGFATVIPWRNLVSPLRVGYDPHCQLSAKLTTVLQTLDWFGRLSVVPNTPADNNMDTLTAVDQNGEYAGGEAFFYAGLRCPLLMPIAAFGLLPGVLWVSQRLWHGRTGKSGCPVYLKPKPFEAPMRQGAGWSFAASLTLVFLLVVAPPMQKANYFPFDNYDTFGWSYGDIANGIIKPVVRLGYYDARNGHVRHLPLNYGGFFEFRMTDDVSMDIMGYLGGRSDTEKYMMLARIWQYIRAERPYHSNQWLLGPMALPCHFVAYSDPLPPQWFRHVYVWLGLYRVMDDRLWRTTGVMAEIPPPPEKRRLWPDEPAYRIPPQMALGNWRPVSMGPSSAHPASGHSSSVPHGHPASI